MKAVTLQGEEPKGLCLSVCLSVARHSDLEQVNQSQDSADVDSFESATVCHKVPISIQHILFANSGKTGNLTDSEISGLLSLCPLSVLLLSFIVVVGIHKCCMTAICWTVPWPVHCRHCCTMCERARNGKVPERRSCMSQ